jgi:hypothetical protein
MVLMPAAGLAITTHGRRADRGDVGEVGDRVVGLLLEHERADRDRRRVREHQGVAVGRRLHDVEPADAAAGAGLVVDDDRLAELLGELLADDAGDDVARPARGEGDDDADRLLGVRGERGPGERGGGARRRRCAGAGGG